MFSSLEILLCFSFVLRLNSDKIFVNSDSASHFGVDISPHDQRNTQSTVEARPLWKQVSTISVDDVGGLGRIFDGIGGISGGGATSKLLMNYKEPHRSHILDYLFLPGFGASLQILKVEIGGDSQSTDGSESSHMHSPDDQNYYRGYEWWLMIEAKKRNPSIKLYGLPWVFPGWIGAGEFNPFTDRIATANYIVNWIDGAWRYHNITIDYIGVWNERTCDVEYVKLLRKTLNQRGYEHVLIVAPDAQDWSILKSMHADLNFAAAVEIIGEHYPGAFSPDDARSLGKRLWCSEDFSAANDLAGGGCWARILNENPVNAKFTGFIAWNLIASYYDGLPYSDAGLMRANEPWSGNYEVQSPIWVSAHHTQFYFPGWIYLDWQHGVGNLSGNGTYIAVTSPDRKQLTIVISTLSPVDVPCFYSMPTYSIIDQQSTKFQLGGSFSGIQKLNIWYSRLDFTSANQTALFQQLPSITVVDGSFTMSMNKNELYTLTTLETGQKGDYGVPPASKPFPVPYKETFDDYVIGAEPYNLAQQSGSFEVVDSGDAEHGKVMKQMVTEPPVDTCLPVRMPRPVNLIGDYNWYNVHVEVDFILNEGSVRSPAASGVFLASQIDTGGCWAMYANGFHYWLSVETKTGQLTANHTRSLVYSNVTVPELAFNRWFTMGLDVQDDHIIATLDGRVIMDVKVTSIPSKHGFVALGPIEFRHVSFDNLNIERVKTLSDSVIRKKEHESRRYVRYRKRVGGT